MACLCCGERWWSCDVASDAGFDPLDMKHDFVEDETRIIGNLALQRIEQLFTSGLDLGVCPTDCADH